MLFYNRAQTSCEKEVIRTLERYDYLYILEGTLERTDAGKVTKIRQVVLYLGVTENKDPIITNNPRHVTIVGIGIIIAIGWPTDACSDTCNYLNSLLGKTLQTHVTPIHIYTQSDHNDPLFYPFTWAALILESKP